MANAPQGQQVRILIIARDQAKFKKAAQFLTRRGWPADVVPGIKQAVEYVVKFRPMFVMVSFSIPNGNITKLPNLLMQTFNANCIAFGEGTDPKTTKRLNSCRLKHIFYGALSGPSIHMRIKKILMEMEKEKQQAARAAAAPPPAAPVPPQQPAQAPQAPQNPVDMGSVQAMDSTPQGEGNFQPQSFNPQADQGGGNFQPQSYNPQEAHANSNFQSSNYNPQEAQGTGNFQPENFNPQQAVGGDFAENPQQQRPQYQEEEGGDNYWNDNKQPKFGLDSDADYDYGADGGPGPGVGQAVDGGQPGEEDPMGLGAAGQMFEDAFAAPPTDPNQQPQSQPVGGADPNAQGNFQPQSFNPQADQGGGNFQPQSYNPQADPNGVGGQMPPGAMDPNQPQGFGSNGDPAQAPVGGAMPPDAASQVGGMQPGQDPNQPGSYNPQAQGGFDPFNPNPNMPDQQGPEAGSPPVNPNDLQDTGFDSSMNPAMDDGGFGQMAEQEPIPEEFDLDAFPPPPDVGALGPNAQEEPAAPAAAAPWEEPPVVMDNEDAPAALEPAPNVEPPPEIGGQRINNQRLKDIAEAFDKGFENAVEGSIEEASRISSSNSIAAVSVRSSDVRGYLLIAMPSEASLGKEFLDGISNSIREQLRSDLLELDVTDTFSLDIQTVSFLDWAANASDFVSVKQHQTYEVAIAFFSVDDVPNVRKSEDVENMSIVDVSAIVPDIQANFRGYINFKKNDKLILYIKKGRSISEIQKNRLMNKSVEEMYIPSEEVETFTSQMARETINRRISSYISQLQQYQATKSVA